MVLKPFNNFRNSYIHLNNLKILFNYINKERIFLKLFSYLKKNWLIYINIKKNYLRFLKSFYRYNKKRRIDLWGFLLNENWNERCTQSWAFDKECKKNNINIYIQLLFKNKLKNKLKNRLKNLLKENVLNENKYTKKQLKFWEKNNINNIDFEWNKHVLFNEYTQNYLSVEKKEANCVELHKIRLYYNNKKSFNKDLWISIEFFKNYKKEIKNSNYLKKNWKNWNDLYVKKTDNSFTELYMRTEKKKLKRFYNSLFDQSLLYQYKRIKLKIINIYCYYNMLFSKYEKVSGFTYFWLKYFDGALASDKRFLKNLEISDVEKVVINKRNFLSWRKKMKNWNVKKMIKCEKWYEAFTSVPINAQEIFLKSWKQAIFDSNDRRRYTIKDAFDMVDSYRVTWWRLPLQNYLKQRWEYTIDWVIVKLKKQNLTVYEIYFTLHTPGLFRSFLKKKLLKILTLSELELLISYLEISYIIISNDYQNKLYRLGSYYKVGKSAGYKMLHLNGRPYVCFDKTKHITTFENDMLLKNRVIF